MQKYDFAPTEVPFSVGENQNSRFKPEPAPPEIVIAETVLETDFPVKKTVEMVSLETSASNDFFDEVSPFDNEIFTPEIPKESSANGNEKKAISNAFLESISIKLPSISSEELEHVEDTKLDELYELKLLWLGDNLLPLKNAALIFEALFGLPAPLNLPETSSQNGTAAAPAKEKRTYEEIIPAFSDDGDIKDLPILSENPTEEELLAYAHAHPLVRKALRIFRGKIIEIKKES